MSRALPPSRTPRRIALASTAVVALLAGAASARADEPPPEPPPPGPSPPTAVTPPRVLGLPYKGQLLECDTGHWEGVDAGFTWQWLLDGGVLPGDTDLVHRVRGAEVGHAVGCLVTGANEAGTTTAESSPVDVVRVAASLVLRGELRQHGPTLRFRGRVVSRGPPARGRIELVREGAIAARADLTPTGSFHLEESIWGLTPGRMDLVLRFRPRDPQLHASTEAPFRLTVESPPTYPFPRSPLDRRTTLFDDLPRFWQDGAACSTGCRPRGARAGWPLEPFSEQHGLRAGINERRDHGFHLGVDIQAHARAPVYAIQPGLAHVLVAHGSEARVRIGSYVYWHLRLLVHEGERVHAYAEPIGTVFNRHRHLHLSELDSSGRYLNPLRPGGRVLAPWVDSEPPVLGAPELHPDGLLTVRAFDPQSFEERTRYVTPVLAPAALGWRTFDTGGRPTGPLHWALRGSHVLPPDLVPSVFTASAHRPGFACFAVELLCIPHWEYRLGWLPSTRIATGQASARRVSVYAWDWAGNVTARDLWLRP